MPFLEGGNIRLLAIMSEQRHHALPDVPTFAESTGLAGFEASGWFGLFAPAQTPAASVSLLNYEINKAFAEPSSRQPLEQQGFEGMQLTPEQFGALVRRDHERWSQVVRSVASANR